MGQLDNRVAVVTGGSRGIGAGIVEAFLREGATVAFNGRSQEKADTFIRAQDAPERLWFCQGSVTVAGDIDKLIDGTCDRFGRVDILVNNAGGSNATLPVADMTLEQWEEDLRWNLTSVFLATQAALRHMVPARYGTIINISSVEGKVASPAMGAYVAAKHGVNGFTKAVAAETGRAGVTVNAICPGLVLTDAVTDGGPEMAANLGMTFDEMVDQLFKSKTLTGEISTIEQVADTAVFLASIAGRGITGTAISVDGGIAPY